MASETLQGPIAGRLIDLFNAITEEGGHVIVIMFDKDLRSTYAGTAILPDTNDKIADILEEETGNLRYKKPKLYLVK